MIVRLVILFLALAAAVNAGAQGMVTLRPVARLDIDAPITLGDITNLTGEAASLAGLLLDADPVSSSGPSRRLTFELDDIRKLITDNSLQSMSRITIRGESCRVLLRSVQTQTITEDAPGPVIQPKALLGLTIRNHVEAKLVQTFGVEHESLQLTFQDSDAVLLATATAGWTVDVQPTGSSAKMPMRITMYDAHGEIRDETIRVGVRILREVVRTTRAIRRGTPITPADFELDTAWLAPDVQYIEPIAATNIRLKRSIGAGEMLTAGHAELAEVVKRGDIVSVHVLSGTIIMRTEARALESGRIGDFIDLEPLQTEGLFTAQIKAPGRVVAIAGATPLEELIR